MSTCSVLIHTLALKSLIAAFNHESNASVRYAAFAIKADVEGYLKVGSLFRAASRAERIHAANDAKAIQSFGGAPVATMEDPVVKTTVENLQAAIANEFHESDIMYPGFIAAAETEMNMAGFKYALEAEKEHAWLFTEALEQLQQCEWQTFDKLSHKGLYFVCPECGFIATRTDFDGCPACGHLKGEFQLAH